MFGKMTNSGQTCVGIDYLLIQKIKSTNVLLGFKTVFQNSLAPTFNIPALLINDTLID